MESSNRNSGYIPRFTPGMLLPKWWPTWLVLGFLRLTVYMPNVFAEAIGSGFGDLFYLLNKKRRRVARINISLCFPELTPVARKKLLRDHFRIYGQTFIDMGKIWWASEKYLDRYIKIEGLEHYTRQREAGKQVILLTGHFVGIDVGGPMISRHYRQIGLIKPIHNKVMDWTLGRGRVRFGSKMLLRDEGMRKVVQAIKDGYGFSYVPDEDFGPERSVFVPFLGTRAPTLTSVSKLARMTNATVIPCFAWRMSAKDGYLVHMHPPLENFPSGDDVADATRVREVLAAAVREHPEQYMWTFKFFRSQPDGKPSPY
ncbi:MAG: lysophospholipid acyltransferase family protein [Acidiferrobacterales bacterium]